MFDKQQEAKKAVHFVTWKRAHYQLSAIKEQFPDFQKQIFSLLSASDARMKEIWPVHWRNGTDRS